MTSPTMLIPSTPMTLIRWRDAKTERPLTRGIYTILRMGATEAIEDAVIVRAYYDGHEWDEDGAALRPEWVISWAERHDIQTGEFVSVETAESACVGIIRRLQESGGDVTAAWVKLLEEIKLRDRLSDIEQLGKGG